MAVKLEVHRVQEFHVETHKHREATGLVALPDVVPISVELRERKPRVHVERRNEIQLVRQPKDSPEKTAIRRIRGEDSTLVWTNQWAGEISEELVVVV